MMRIKFIGYSTSLTNGKIYNVIDETVENTWGVEYIRIENDLGVVEAYYLQGWFEDAAIEYRELTIDNILS